MGSRAAVELVGQDQSPSRDLLLHDALAHDRAAKGNADGLSDVFSSFAGIPVGHVCIEGDRDREAICRLLRIAGVSCDAIKWHDKPI